MTTSPDVLAQLSECKLRGISFPVVMLASSHGHRVVPHARVDRNGDFAENLGRKSAIFKGKAPFINTIARGVNETWSELFPTTFNKVVAALEDRSTGPFQHPLWGARTCKVLDWEDTLDPDFRGGPTLSFTLTESVDGDQAALALSSDVSIAAAAAVTLDAQLGALTPPPMTGTPGAQSLTDFVKGLGAIADQTSLLVSQVEGKIDSVISAMTGLAAKFGATPGFSDATNRLISALHAVKQRAGVGSKPVSFYVVPRSTTVASIANRLQRKVADLLAMNPLLARSPIVEALTVVRYV